MKEKEIVRMCSTFYCDARGDRYCCADCGRRAECVNPCLNHPDRCRLVQLERKKKKKRWEDGKVGKLHDQLRAWYDRGMSDKEIGKLVGISKASVGVWRRKNGLPSNYRKEKRQEDG